MSTPQNIATILGLSADRWVRALVFQKRADNGTLLAPDKQHLWICQHSCIEHVDDLPNGTIRERYLRVQCPDDPNTAYYVVVSRPYVKELSLRFPHDTNAHELNTFHYAWSVRDILLPDGILDHDPSAPYNDFDEDEDYEEDDDDDSEDDYIPL